MSRKIAPRTLIKSNHGAGDNSAFAILATAAEEGEELRRRAERVDEDGLEGDVLEDLARQRTQEGRLEGHGGARGGEGTAHGGAVI